VAAAHAWPLAGTVLAGVGVTGTAAAVRLGLWWRTTLRAWIHPVSEPLSQSQV
jgi:hypothetical protein